MRIYIRGLEKPLISKALDNALKELGALPDELGKLQNRLTKEIRRNAHNRILHRRSGRLEDSWDWSVNRMEGGWTSVTASDVAYARIHDLGGMTGRNHATRIPARRYVSRATDKLDKKINKMLTKWGARLFRNYGK